MALILLGLFTLFMLIESMYTGDLRELSTRAHHKVPVGISLLFKGKFRVVGKIVSGSAFVKLFKNSYRRLTGAMPGVKPASVLSAFRTGD
ncbi:MAG: hypothetical protein OEV31_02615 [Gammaproteobacteria bacterium]|nr:hypothetical protein [Gammaproteobacteria bacterium]